MFSRLEAVFERRSERAPASMGVQRVNGNIGLRNAYRNSLTIWRQFEMHFTRRQPLNYSTRTNSPSVARTSQTVQTTTHTAIRLKASNTQIQQLPVIEMLTSAVRSNEITSQLRRGSVVRHGDHSSRSFISYRSPSCVSMSVCKHNIHLSNWHTELYYRWKNIYIWLYILI